MVKLEEIASTSTFAWSHDTLPLLVTGTVAGAVDANFSSASQLAVYDIFSPTSRHQPVLTAKVAQRFYALAWSKPFGGHERGLIAAALEDGSIEFWDAATVIKTGEVGPATVHSSSRDKKSLVHTSGPAKSLAFNPSEPHRLVSGGAQGQLFVWDCANFGQAPKPPGTAMTPMGEVTSVAWNNAQPHILASTSTSGYASVWDLKCAREVLHLKYTSAAGATASFSQVAWHPTASTKLVTASDADGCPVILTWDLRNAMVPEKVMEGHQSGVLSLDWCRHDPSLMLSAGKDNTTVLWNPLTGARLGEYPTTANWTFHVRFAPSAPDIFATASFDGKVIVQSLQDTSPPVAAAVAHTSADDDSFWSHISTAETQQPKFDVLQAPQWLRPPVSVRFGFGNKLAIVRTRGHGSHGQGQSGHESVHAHSEVEVTQFRNPVGDTAPLKQALASHDFASVIARGTAEAHGDNKADWELLAQLKARPDHYVRELSPPAPPAAENPDDSFFDHLDEQVGYVPEGAFELAADPVVTLALANRVDAAVSHCLDHGHLEEAFVLAMDASPATKAKVQNAYFNKNRANPTARVLYSVTRGDVSDVVAHADVSSWKTIAGAVSSFSAGDPAKFAAQVSQLGDRLRASSRASSRADAMACYAAAGNLDRIAAVWLDELPAFEQSLTAGSAPGVSSPADARFAALDNFVQKVASYRALTGTTSTISSPAVARAVLEYVGLVAAAGDFELAAQFLPLLPAETAAVESDRITTAMAKATTSATHKGSAMAKGTAMSASSSANAGGRYARASPAKPANPYGQPAPVASQMPPPSVAQVPSVAPPVAPASSYAGSQYGGPPTSAYSAPPTAPGFPPVPSFAQPPGRASPAAGRANPYARSNPYAPSAAQAPQPPANPYAPQGMASPAPQFASMNGASAPVAPPPSGPAKKKEEGWNDLPDGIKLGAPPRRAAASAATPAPAAFGQPPAPTAPPFQPPHSAPRPGPSRSPSGLTRPPTGGARQLSTSLSPAMNSPSSGHLTPSKYAPPPGSVPPPAQVFDPSASASGRATPHKAPKNPYAPSGIPHVPQQGPLPPSTSFAAPPAPAPAPAANPYAPKASAGPPAFSSSAEGAFAPPPMSGGFGSGGFGNGPGSPPVGPPPSGPARVPSASAPPPPGPARVPSVSQVSQTSQGSPAQAGQPPHANAYAPQAPQAQANAYAPQAQANAYAPGQAPGQAPNQAFGQAPAMGQAPNQAPPMGSGQPLGQPPVAPMGGMSSGTATPAPPQPEAKKRHPAGDRTHIPAESRPIFETLSAVHDAIKPKIPERFAKHGVDMNKRLNILYDHLNNEDLLSDGAIAQLKEICSALAAKDIATAASLNLALSTNFSDEMGQWNTGLKRLITMAEALYD
ncbi:protein transport protein Sec31p [Diutina catenulata]